MNTKFDKIVVWAALALSSLGTVVYTVALFTELDRIARDFWEDGIILGLCYSSFTLAGVLRTIRPHLPQYFHLASALANALFGFVVVMFWFGLFTGKIDRGAEFVVILMSVAYVIALRAVRIKEYFRPPTWLIGVVFVVTVLHFVVPEILLQQARSLDEARRAAVVTGLLRLVTVPVWGAFLISGFWWRWKELRLPESDD